MLCTQVLNGVVSGARRPEVRRRHASSTSSRSASTRRKDQGSPRRRSRPTSSATSGPQTAGGWHFLTGKAGVDQAADGGGGLPLRVRRRDRAVRARRRDRGADAEGRHLAVLLRHRVLAARPPARADRGLGGADRHASSTTCCCFCYHYDPSTGKYGADRHRRSIRIGGVATVLAFVDVPVRQPAPGARGRDSDRRTAPFT